MRYLLICLFPLLLLAACSDDEQLSPVDQLPPATQTGVGMMACLIDGEPWVNSPDGLGFQGIQTSVLGPPSNRISVIGISDEIKSDDSYQSLIIRLPLAVDMGMVEVDSSTFRFIDRLPTVIREKRSLLPSMCQLNVTHIDSEAGTLSGEFDAILIDDESRDTINLSEGRFDVSL